MKIITELAKPISRSFLNYLHLSEWVNQRLTSVFSGKSVRTFESVEDFWKQIFEETLYIGDRIRFKEAFIMEWLPRSPGELWLDNLKQFGLELDALRKGHPIALSSLISNAIAPLGVIRLPFGDSNESYAALSLTTVDSWHCDLGIPVIVSSSVYDSFLSRRIEGNAVAGEVEAILCFGEIPLFSPKLISSLGSDVNIDFLSSISTHRGLPNVYLKVVSPLDVKFNYHDTHPPGFVWCIDRQVRDKQVIHSPVTPKSAKKPRIDIKDTEPYLTYGFSAISTQISDRNELQSCLSCLKAGNFSYEQQSTVPSPESIIGLVQLDILTEFDARCRYFKTSVPLTKEPWKDEKSLKQMKRTFIDLQQI
ncbi:hypothetical protein [Leptothoe kymatousa]|uniref:Uncharacterized protein n=1 Tax=Leptothoe kymatousa TAU-MAC 1615 TaxID=2364775 RepID=A0ABS5Y2F6_9CYAN|nr:hypothetical protein [Leptothoe kymatousa]MBT9312019.1 hypothetical protein [Leptothoe kymatousa TAU-MAC 1615]